MMRVGLSMYGTMFTMGMHPESDRRPWTAVDVMQRAIQLGLVGVSLPHSLLVEEELDNIGRFAKEHDLYITVDTSGYDSNRLKDTLVAASRVGAEVVRTVVGGARIGGDRRPLAGRWQGFVEEVRRGFTDATEEAERLCVNLAVENHQDLASEDLLMLCESIGSARFGITLDAANPLATAEVPIDFFTSMAPYIKNVHLKDYWMYLSDEGYRLVRCPVGQGVVDFPGLFQVLRDANLDVPMSIELAALEARHIRVLADDFWPDYAPRTAHQFASVMRFVLSHASSGDDWRTPYERHQSPDAICAYEEFQLQESLSYLREVPSLQ